jgi:hypothetical protein
MRRIFFVLFFAAACLGLAQAQETQQTQQTKNLKIVISGITLHKDYEDLVNGLKRIVGVSDIFTASESRGRIVLTGRFVGETGMLVNDAQALVMDRYKFDKKERKDVIELSLTKL